LILPHDEEEQQAVEFGVLRGLLEITGQMKAEVTGQVKAAETTAPPQPASWYKRIFS
jgi:hypothetical protein